MRCFVLLIELTTFWWPVSSAPQNVAKHPKAPLMMYALGCSGSSICGRISRLLLAEIGIKAVWGGFNQNRHKPIPDNAKRCPYDDTWESLKPEKNCFYQVAARMHNTTYAESVFVEQTARAALKRDAVWLANPPPLEPHAAEALRRLNANIVFMYRENLLDRLICRIRDCFASQRLGYAVNGSTGNATHMCFGRRKKPLGTTKAHVVAKTLLPQLRRMREDNSKDEVMLRDTYGFKMLQTVTYEALTAFEHGDIERSAPAWYKVMQAWGIESSREVIYRLLQQAKFFNSRHPSPPHKEVLWNYDQVRDEILRSRDEEFISFLRQ